MSLQVLIDKLQSLQEHLEFTERSDYLTDDDVELSKDAQSIVDEIVGLSDSVLITAEGRPDSQSIHALKQHGYNVVPGERDSFGWLTGIIITPKGRIVFG